MDQSKEFEEILAWYDIVPTEAQRELFRRAIMIIDNASDTSWQTSAAWQELLSGIRRSRSTDSRTALGVHPKDAKSVSGDAPRGTGSTFAVPGSVNDETRPGNGCASWSSS